MNVLISDVLICTAHFQVYAQNKADCLKISIKPKTTTFFASHHTSTLVIRHAFFEKVCLALQRDQIHKVKGVRYVVMLWKTERYHQSISYKLDILTHKLFIHTNQPYWKDFSEKALFNCYSLGQDLQYYVMRGLINNMVE